MNIKTLDFYSMHHKMINSLVQKAKRSEQGEGQSKFKIIKAKRKKIPFKMNTILL